MVTFRLFSVRDGDTFREPVLDEQGRQVVYFGEIVVFDVTPRNAANQPCEAEGEPEYWVENNGPGNEPKYLKTLGSSNPFLLRMEVVGRTGANGPVRVYAKVDGKTSNNLWVVAK